VTHEFKPGMRVKWQHGEFTVADEADQPVAIRSNGGVFHVRPSELTPAEDEDEDDPIVAKVRELVKPEIMTREGVAYIDTGKWDNDPIFVAFAKYLRANPPQAPLAHAALREAVEASIGHYCSTAELAVLHAHLTKGEGA